AIAAAMGTIFGEYWWTVFTYAKTTFFWQEIYPSPLTVRDQSFLIAYPYRLAGGIAWLCAVAGAALAAIYGEGRVRRFAVGFLVFIGLLSGILVVLGDSWKGPRPAYLDSFVYPLYACFAALLVFAAMSAVGMALQRRRGVLQASPWTPGTRSMTTL